MQGLQHASSYFLRSTWCRNSGLRLWPLKNNGSFVGFGKGDSVKAGDKLQKLLMLLITWGLLLVFFVGYEIYFVRGQEQFLQANGFRSLGALAKELSAKFNKARTSTESLVRLMHEKRRDPQEIDAYLALYLEGSTVISDERKWNCASIVSLGNQTRVPLSFMPRDNALVLSVSCFERNNDDTPKADRSIP